MNSFLTKVWGAALPFAFQTVDRPSEEADPSLR